MSTCLREKVSLTGPRGRLDGELCYPIETPRAVLLLCNPHPLMGGQMDNNVIAALAELLAESGAITLRFDYAGVGASEGPQMDLATSMAAFWQDGRAPEDPHMVRDAQAALHFAQELTDAPLIVVGYSFGAYVAQTIAAQCAAVRGLGMISPTLTQHTFATHLPHPLRRLVIFSDNDFATPAQATQQWLAQCLDRPEAVCITGGEHFFKGCEAEVTDAVRRLMNCICERPSGRGN